MVAVSTYRNVTLIYLCSVQDIPGHNSTQEFDLHKMLRLGLNDSSS